MRAIKLGHASVLDAFMSRPRREEVLGFSLACAAKESQSDIVEAILDKLGKFDDELLLHDVLRQTDTQSKTALEYAVLNQDVITIIRIIRREHECHKWHRKAGHICLREQLANDKMLKWTREQFDNLFVMEKKEEVVQFEVIQSTRPKAERPKKPKKSMITGLIGILPNIMSIILLFYDVYSDIELSIRYYFRGFGRVKKDLVSLAILQQTECSDINLKPTNNCTDFMRNLKCLIRNTSAALTVTKYIYESGCSIHSIDYSDLFPKKCEYYRLLKEFFGTQV